MRPATIEVMHEQVRAIYRALTGAELDGEGGAATAMATESASEQPQPADDEVARSFADLDALARQNRLLDERIPPFSFTPLADVFDSGDDLIVEVMAAGVEQGDVEVEAHDRDLTVRGVRRGERGARDKTYVRAEIPRGPFSRAIELPCAVEPRAELDVQRGIILIRLRKS
jgi:HSP20 family molecular chaperone IbpA